MRIEEFVQTDTERRTDADRQTFRDIGLLRGRSQKLTPKSLGCGQASGKPDRAGERQGRNLPGDWGVGTDETGISGP